MVYQVPGELHSHGPLALHHLSQDYHQALQQKHLQVLYLSQPSFYVQNVFIVRQLLSTSTTLSKQAQVEHSSNWSYVCGPGSPPLLGITIGQGVDIAADTFGDREGLVVSQQGVRRNFTQLKQEIDMLAAGFLELGLVPGDRLGIWGPNTHEWYLTQV